MSVRRELRDLAAAVRGAIEWHLETGDAALPVPKAWRMPPLGAGEPMRRPPPVVVEAPPTPPPTPRPEVAPAPAPPPPAPSPPAAAEPPAIARAAGAAGSAAALRVVRDELGDCKRCALCQGRQEIVFGAGHPDARLMFVAEAPAEADDLTGAAFVDPGGVLLSRMVHAMGLRRADVYTAYVVMCRPSGRGPTDDEVGTCSEWLARQIEVVRPDVIVALGSLVARVVTGRNATISVQRGDWGEATLGGLGTPVMPTFALEAMLQNSKLKAPVWADLRKVMRRLDLPERGRG